MKIHVCCSSAIVFCTSLVLILAKFAHKLATSDKALAKWMSTACLPSILGRLSFASGLRERKLPPSWRFCDLKEFDNSILLAGI